MTTVRLLPSLARAAAAVAVVAASAGALSAQQRTLYAWTGRVDRELLLVMKGGDVNARTGFGLGSDRGRFRVGADLPRTDGSVDVRVSRGRGSVDVVQQPSSRNDYTAVVRVRDDADGAGDYQITTYWQPANGSYAGGYGDNGGYGNGGYGDHGGYGRGDNDGRDDGRWEDRRDRREERRDRRDDRRDRRDGRDRDNGGWGNGRWGNGRWDTGNGGSGTLRWSGRVDDVQEIRIRGRRASSYTVSGGGAYDVRTSVSGSGLPDRNVTVRVRTFDGRGSVRVVQQPSARNDYTAVLRVEDRQGGAGYYDFEASWY